MSKSNLAESRQKTIDILKSGMENARRTGVPDNVMPTARHDQMVFMERKKTFAGVWPGGCL